jgi:hypothetical protein
MASSREIRAGKAYVEVGVKDRLRSGLSKMGRQMKAFALGAVRMGAVAGAAITAFTAAAIKQFADFGDALNKASARTGVAVETLSELKFAAEQSGASLGAVEKSIRRMAVSIMDATKGSKMAREAFEDIGISVGELSRMKPEDQFMAIMKALDGVENASQRAALAQKIFGRTGAELLPMIGNIEELRWQAEQLGLTLSEEGAQAAADITDAINTIKSAWKGMFTTVLAGNAEFLTAMAKMTEVFARNLQRVVGAIGRNIVVSTLEGFKGVLDFFGAENLAVDFAVAGTGMANQKANMQDIGAILADFIASNLPSPEEEPQQPDPGNAPLQGPAIGYQNLGPVVADNASGAVGRFTSSITSAGSFVGGAGIGQGEMVRVQENQLQEAKKTNGWLEGVYNMLNTQNGNTPNVFTGGQ